MPSSQPNSSDTKMKVLIAAGGTGGHIFPGIATGLTLKKLYPQYEVYYACGERELELNIYKNNNITPVVFPSRQLGSGIMSKINGVLAALKITVAARKYIRQNNIDVVIGFGGYVSGPVTLGGVLAGVKTAVHEANSIPGKTNKILAPLVNLTAVHFPITTQHLKGRKTVVVGMPIRPLTQVADTATARESLGLDLQKQTLLIMGGSQGAKYLYEKITAALPALDKELKQPIQILWSTGQNNFSDLESVLSKLSLNNITVKLTPFISDVGTALSAATIAVARAGASALAELTAFNIYTLYVPFPAAIYDHQTLNAQQIEKYGAGLVLPEKSLSDQVITHSILKAFQHVSSSSKNSVPEELNSSNAAERLAKELTSLLSVR